MRLSNMDHSVGSLPKPPDHHKWNWSLSEEEGSDREFLDSDGNTAEDFSFFKFEEFLNDFCNYFLQSLMINIKGQ